MIRILLLFAALIGMNPLWSQETDTLPPVDEHTGLITYQEVVEQEGTPSKLFDRAVAWINDYFPNPDNVIRDRNREEMEMRGIHRFKIKNTDEEGFETDAGVIQYDFRIEFKEGRYRYTLTDFALRQASKIPVEKWMDKEDPTYIPEWDSYLQQIDAFSKELINSLKEGMKPTPEINDDDW